MKKYQIIYADPPYEMGIFGKGRDNRIGRIYKVGEVVKLSYPTMTEEEICALPVGSISNNVCHLWLWATNRSLHSAFHIMDAWGFKYLNILTFNKPAGVGAWFVNTTQHLLFGYKGKLEMGRGRYTKTSQFFTPKANSKKPDSVYDLIENVSPYQNKIELFARQKIFGWDCWGNEVESDIDFEKLPEGIKEDG
jgi:N6-adenosine-specific RNA methylase IME4